MKELDASVINAVDLDVPEDILMFAVLQQPHHGFLVKGVYGNNISHYRRAIISQQYHEIQVDGFSMEALKNGKGCIPFGHVGSFQIMGNRILN